MAKKAFKAFFVIFTCARFQQADVLMNEWRREGSVKDGLRRENSMLWQNAFVKIYLFYFPFYLLALFESVVLVVVVACLLNAILLYITMLVVTP